MFLHVKDSHRHPVDEGDRWIVLMSPLTSTELPSGPAGHPSTSQQSYLIVEIDAQTGAFVTAIGG